jgi:uncharacterized protein (TIGR02266 family)
MDDLRKTARISTNLKLISRKSGSCIDSYIMNMSSGGAFIQTSRLLPVDSEFALNLQLPGDPEIIPIDGRVVWTKSVSNASPAGMGIQFTNIQPHHEMKLAAFVEQNRNPDSSQEPVKLYL